MESMAGGTRKEQVRGKRITSTNASAGASADPGAGAAARAGAVAGAVAVAVAVAVCPLTNSTSRNLQFVTSLTHERDEFQNQKFLLFC